MINPFRMPLPSSMINPFMNTLPPDLQAMIRNQNLMALASGLLSAAGPSLRPTGFAQGMGRGLAAMNQQQGQGVALASMLDQRRREQERQAKQDQDINALASVFPAGSPQAALARLSPSSAENTIFPKRTAQYAPVPGAPHLQQNLLTGQFSAIPQAPAQYAPVPGAPHLQRNTQTGQVSAIPQAPKPTSDDERRGQIETQATAMGLQLAPGQVDGILAGTLSMDIDPSSGRVILKDLLRGTATEVPLQAGRAPSKQVTVSQDKPMPDAPKLFPYGGGMNIRGMADRWLGMFFGDTDVAKSRQEARLLREDMIATFSRSGRPSNFAQQRVEELLPSMANPLASEASARAELETTRIAILDEMASARKVAENPSQSTKAREEARAQLRAGERAMKKLSRILSAGRAQPARSAPEPGTIEDGYRFKGGNPADPNSWVKVQ